MTHREEDIKIKSVKKAADVLNCFLDKQPLGISEISHILNLYKSNVYDILCTLTALDFLEKDPDSGKYYLGSNIVRLGRAAGDRYTFHNAAAAHIRAISEQLHEIVYLTVPLDGKVYYIDAAYPPESNSFIMSTLRNNSDPMHCSSGGKCMLAFSGSEYINEYLKKPLIALTDKTFTDPEALRKELQLIRVRGYATDFDEAAPGISCVGVPILSHNGTVLGAMSVSGASKNLSEEKIVHFSSILKQHVKDLSEFL